MTNRPKAIYGLDLSLTATGIASSAGWTELVGKSGITTMPLADRSTALSGLVEQIVLLVGNADLIVAEAPAFSKAGGGASERHGLYWLLVRRLLGLGIPIAEVTTGGLKKYATGKGNADKGAIVDAVARRWPTWHTGGNDNLADAVVLCAMGLDQYGHPAATVPKTHRAALNAIAWPELPNLTRQEVTT